MHMDSRFYGYEALVKGPETRPKQLCRKRMIGNEYIHISKSNFKYMCGLEVFINQTYELPCLGCGGLDKQSWQCDVITRT